MKKNASFFVLFLILSFLPFPVLSASPNESKFTQFKTRMAILHQDIGNLKKKNEDLRIKKTDDFEDLKSIIEKNENEIQKREEELENIQEKVKELAEVGVEALDHALSLHKANYYEALADYYVSAKKTDISDFKSVGFNQDETLIKSLRASLSTIRSAKEEDIENYLSEFSSKISDFQGRTNDVDGSIKALEIRKRESKPPLSEDEKELLETKLKKEQLRSQTLEAALEAATNPEEGKEYPDLSEKINQNRCQAEEMQKLARALEGENRDSNKAEEEEIKQEVLAEMRTSARLEEGESCVLKAAGGVGSGLKSIFWDIPATGFEKVGGGLSTLADGIIKVDDLLTEYGRSAKLGLFSIFSALAQYQYTQKGSKNSATQVFRAMGIVLGQDMALKGQLPRGLEGLGDPLQPFKREPIALQQRLDSQQKILDSVLTMGGDPSRPGGFPSGTHEQLQRILKGSVFPGGLPDFQLPPSFPGVYDPNFVNFSRQAFNGFPPFPTTQTRGALLNPNFALNNPFSRGSGAVSNNFKTVSHGDGVAAVANLTAATAVVKGGVEDFSAQLENINPQDNSLKSLIDDIPGREARGIALGGRKDGLSSLLSDPRQERLLDLQREQATLIIQKQNEVAQRNKEIFEATLEFRRQDFYVQPDEDGLLPKGGKDFSKRFARRTDALIRIQDLTRQRAAAIEALALIRNNFLLFKRLQEGGSPVIQPSFGLLKYFTIKSLLAEEKKEIFVPNWRQMAEKELQKADREIEGNRKKLETHLSHLRLLVALDPDGVHEINAEAVQMEKMNMKALAWQAKDNLRKLEKAESDVNINVTLTEEEKKKIRSDLESYKAAFSNLEKAADGGENQLSRVERLQREKMERSDLFDYYQEVGKQLIVKYAQ